MMSFLGALQTIAAQRGDGLRPELAKLLEGKGPRVAESELDERHTHLSNENSRSPVILKVPFPDR